MSQISPDLTDVIAAAIHETWRDLSSQQGWKMQPHLDQPYAGLEEPDKQDNRAAARRMASVLATAGLALTPNGPAIPAEILQSHMETLAAAGAGEREIQLRVLGREALVGRASFGEYSKRGFVRAALADRTHLTGGM